MKILFLLESTITDDAFLYTKALVEDLAADGYEPKIVFTTRGAPSDHTYQLVKPHVVHHLTKLCFRSREPDYMDRLAGHINRTGYDFVVTSQAVFPGTDIQPVVVKGVYGMLEKKPRLIFLGNQCSDSVRQDCEILKDLNPKWAAVSSLIAKVFMNDGLPDEHPDKRSIDVLYGPAVVPEGDGVDIRAEFGLRGGIKVLGYFGNVDVVNWEPVVEACRRMRCGLLIAGTGDRLPHLAEGPCKVVPAIPQLRADWYRAVDCFLYPVRSAGFPMLPLEAAMCGCPVAMSPVGDSYQMLQDYFGFFAFRPESVIEAVQFAAKVDQEKNKREIAEKFSREKFLSGWQMLLSS